MTYATQVDLETRYGADEILALADRGGNGVADSGVVSGAIATAEVEIDGYLAVKYSLPLATVPVLVTQLACDIARYRLWKDRASEQVRQGYEDAVDILKRLAGGGMRLTDVAGTEAATDPATVSIVGPDRVFGRASGGGLA
jgi:phage gp36-like protein